MFVADSHSQFYTCAKLVPSIVIGKQGVTDLTRAAPSAIRSKLAGICEELGALVDLCSRLDLRRDIVVAPLFVFDAHLHLGKQAAMIFRTCLRRQPAIILAFGGR